MWPFSGKKEPVEIPSETKELISHSPTEELRAKLPVLKQERDNPELSTSEHVNSLLKATFLSPEALIGSMVGGFVAPSVSAKVFGKYNLSKNPKRYIGEMIGGTVVLGAIAGLNAYRRYNNEKREHITEEKQAELNFVEKVIAEREAPAAGIARQ